MVLTTLQRSIYAVALGKPSKPDFFSNGVPKNSLIEEFSVRTQIPDKVQYHIQPCIASNGKHLYILCGKSLFKIGTGFNGTLKGYVYGMNPEFCKEKNGWIGFCGVSLARLKSRSRQSNIYFNVSIFRIHYFIRKFRNEAMRTYSW